MISYSIKRLLGLHLALAVAFPILSPLTGRAGDQLAAQPPPPPPVTKIPEGNFLSFWDGRLVIDIEERVRVEWRENTRDFDSSLSDDNDDSWILNRFRFGLAVKPVSWLRIYGQSQDSREADSDRANIPGIRSAEGDDEWDLRQGYIALGDLKKFPLLFTVGRQAISYGDGRLVSDSRWGNFGRTFDALRIRWEKQYYFWVEAFAMRPVQILRHEFNDSDSADNFFGTYFSTDYGTKQAIDFYVYYRHKDDNQPNLDPTNRVDPQGTYNGPAGHYATLGARTKNTSDKLNGWDYAGEFAYQVGTVFLTDTNSQSFNLNAFALAVAGGYTWKDHPWKPRVGIEFDYATGDNDPTHGNSQSFQNLFPSNHDKYGLMDEFSWRNIQDLRFLQVNVKPLKKLELQFNCHAFWLANTHDFWYRSNGNSILRTRTPDGQDVRTIGAPRSAGQELDLIATYTWTKNIQVQGGFSHFFAGPYLRATGPASDANFGYGMINFTF